MYKTLKLRIFKRRIDELYRLTQNDEAFAPEQFVASLQGLQAELDRGGGGRN